LPGRGLWDELITRQEESYQPWCVVVCDLETSGMRRPWPALGRSATGEYIYIYELTASTIRNINKKFWKGGIHWIDLAQCRKSCQALLNEIMKLRIPQTFNGIRI
jgi:hypothetical protein